MIICSKDQVSLELLGVQHFFKAPCVRACLEMKPKLRKAKLRNEERERLLVTVFTDSVSVTPEA